MPALIPVLALALILCGPGGIASASATGIALRLELALAGRTGSEPRAEEAVSHALSAPLQLKLHRVLEHHSKETFAGGSARNDTLALLFEAIDRHRQGALALAEPLYRRVLALPAPPVQAHIGLARLLARRDGARAAAEYLEAAHTDTGDALLAREAAIWWVEAGEDERAKRCLLKAEGLRRAEDDALLASLHLMAGRYEEAVAAYQRALAQGTGRAGWWLGLALGLQGQGNRVGALAAYRRAMSSGELPPAVAAFIQARLGQD